MVKYYHDYWRHRYYEFYSLCYTTITIINDKMEDGDSNNDNSNINDDSELQFQLKIIIMI